MTRIRLVLHDWNGSLLDDVQHRFEHGVCAIFRHYGLPIPTLEDYCRTTTSDFMRFYYDRGIPSSGDKEHDGAVLDAIMVSNMAKAPVPPLFPDTRVFLDALRRRGITQALVSSLIEEEFRRQVGHHRLAPYFHDLRGGIRRKAPVFQELLTKHGIHPSEAVGVTDMMSDARELAEVGVTPIILPRGYIVPDVKEVPTLLVAEDFAEALSFIDRS